MSNVILEKTVDLNVMMFDDHTNSIEMLQGSLLFTMITGAPDDSAAAINEARIMHSINFAKCLTFLETMLDRSVVMQSDCSDSLYTTLAQYSNNLVTLPEVNESTLLSTIHCKLNTICGEDTHVDFIKITDAKQALSYSYVQEEPESYPELPGSQAEWLGDRPYWDTPWWYRDDITTVDRNAGSDEEMEAWLQARQESNMDELNVAIFREIEDTVRNVAGGENPGSSGEIIEVDFEKQKPWTPKLV